MAILIPLLLGSALTAQAPEEAAGAGKPRVAVMGVQVVGFPDAVAELFTESLAQGAARNEAYSVLSQAEITSILGLEAQKQLLGCSDGSCMAELAGALDARYLISGKVVKLGAVSNLSVSMVDISETTSMRREHMEVKDDGEVVRWLRFLGAKVVGIDPGDDLSRDVGIVTGPRWKVGASLALAGLGVSSPVVLESVGFDPDRATDDPRGFASHPTLHDVQWNANLGFAIDFGYQLKHWLRLEVGFEHDGLEGRLPYEATRLVATFLEGGDDRRAFGGIQAGCPVVFSDEAAANAYNAAIGDLNGTGAEILGGLLNEFKDDGSPGRVLTDRSTANASGAQCYPNTLLQSIQLSIPVVLRPTRFLAVELGPRLGFGVMTFQGWVGNESQEGSPGAGILLLGGRFGISFLFKGAFPRLPLDLTLDLRGTVQYLRAISTDLQVYEPETPLGSDGNASSDSDLLDSKVRIEMIFPSITVGLGMRF